MKLKKTNVCMCTLIFQVHKKEIDVPQMFFLEFQLSCKMTKMYIGLSSTNPAIYLNCKLQHD